MYNRQIGDIYITRNLSDNNSPGYWNHAAILSIKDYVVEAQSEPKKVIAIPFNIFWSRYPEIRVLRFKNNNQQMGLTAVSLVGKEYNKFNMNCVTVLRLCYIASFFNDFPKWYIPDDLSVDQNLYTVCYKEESDGWTESEEWYKGMITDKEKLI